MVNITSPADGATFYRRSQFTAAATVTDNVKVAEVRFLLDSNTICRITVPAYQCRITLNKYRGWTGTVQVRATDTSGNVTSKSVRISVR